MELARNGRGLDGLIDNASAVVTSSGTVTPFQDSTKTSIAMEQSLYTPNENVCIPWMDVFPFTFQDKVYGAIDYFGISIGADGMVDPEELVIQDGNVLQIKSLVPETQHDIEEAYETRQDKYMAKAAKASGEEKASLKRKYNMLEARRTAQYKAVRDMKSVKGDNWKVQYTRVALSMTCDKEIVSMEIHEGKKGVTLAIDLKVVQDNVHIDAMTAKRASASQSPGAATTP